MQGLRCINALITELTVERPYPESPLEESPYEGLGASRLYAPPLMMPFSIRAARSSFASVMTVARSVAAA